jgi:hypothetical protein
MHFVLVYLILKAYKQMHTLPDNGIFLCLGMTLISVIPRQKEKQVRFDCRRTFVVFHELISNGTEMGLRHARVSLSSKAIKKQNL